MYMLIKIGKTDMRYVFVNTLLILVLFIYLTFFLNK